jgi:hypothetical protein
MAAVTINTADAGRGYRLLETVTITDQAAASTAVRKAVKVPGWAESCTFFVLVRSMAGTTPLFDFKLEVPDIFTDAKFAAPDDGALSDLGGWDGITQLTAAASPVLILVDVGPEIAADDSGSATASCRYGVNASLTPWIAYKYTTAGNGAAKEDYAFDIAVQFRGRAQA